MEEEMANYTEPVVCLRSVSRECRNGQYRGIGHSIGDFLGIILSSTTSTPTHYPNR